MIRVLVTWDGTDTKVAVDPPDAHDTNVLSLLLGASKQIERRVAVKTAEGWANYELHRIARDWRFKP